LHRFKKWGWGLGIATVTAVTAFGVASWSANAAPTPAPTGAAGDQARVSDPKPAPEAVSGVGNDALTTDEVGRARTAALTPALVGRAEDVTGAGGPEYLSSEVLADGEGRRAEVFYYDYASDELVKQVVDTASGKVVGSYRAKGLQPAASRREVATALDLVLADPLGGQLKDAYAKATGRAFAGKDDVTVTAHVYRAKPADSGAEKCGQHRCLQLVVQADADGKFVDVNDIIIDLSGRTVARLS
jgi:hypothetical protein